MSRPALRRGAAWASALMAAVAVFGGCGSNGDEAPPSAAVGTTTTDVSLAVRANGSGEGCLLEPGAVSAALGVAVSESGPVAGRAADEGSGDYYVSWRGCTYRTADGTEVAVAELVDGEEPAVTGFDRLADRAAGTGDGPRTVAGIGDQAVRDGEHLFVRVGDRAAVAEGETAAGRPLPASTVEALAAAAADALR